jgi:hypothetical protein
LKMKTLGSFETSSTTYPKLQHPISEDQNPRSHRCKELKPPIYFRYDIYTISVCLKLYIVVWNLVADIEEGT